MVLSLAAALSVGGGYLLAQAPAPVVNRPSSAPVMTVVRGTGAGTATSARRGGPVGQPNMVRAYLSLQEAKRALEDAAPDKGGFREKALQSVEQAIKDVGAGVEYAKAHPEEGGTGGVIIPRGPAGGRGVTMPGNSSFGGQTPSGVSPSSK